MAGEVIVDVPEHLAALLGIRPQHARPRFELAAPVYLNSRIVDDALVGAHPADVQKVGGGTCRELHHLLARNPASVAQRQGDVVLGEESKDAVVDPAALPELDREANVARKLGKELRDSRQLRGPEIRTELDQNRPQLWP